jgi:hypothetical protein
MLRAVGSELTWEDIERMRAERLPPFVVKAQKIVALASRPDPRLPSNTAAHVQRPLSAKELTGKMTPARAAKLRRLSMAACPCRLCALALNPPLTFADAVRFTPDAGGWASVNALQGVELTTPTRIDTTKAPEWDETLTRRDEPI